jgi:hypothetical protein
MAKHSYHVESFSMMDRSFMQLSCPLMNGVENIQISTDHRNNTTISLTQKNGVVNFSGALLDESNAQKVWSHYTSLCDKVRKEMDVDRKIAEFQPRIEIHHAKDRNEERDAGITDANNQAAGINK